MCRRGGEKACGGLFTRPKCPLSSQEQHFSVYFVRRSVDFCTSMDKICSHVEELVQKYDARYGLVAWYAGNQKLHIAATHNLGDGQLYLKDLTDMVRETMDRIAGKMHLIVYPQIVKTIWGRGHSKFGTTDSQGFYNKKNAISTILSRLDKAGNTFPVIVLLSSRNKSSSFTVPLGDRRLSNQAKNLLGCLDQGVKKENTRLVSQVKADLAPDDTMMYPQVKKRRTFRASMARRRSDGYVGIDVSHKTGTVQWYSSQLGSSKSPGVHPLYKTDAMYKWAMVDARVSGMNMTVQHNMFVEVSLLHEGGQWDVSCTCDVFNTWNDATCVHKEFLKLDHERLTSMRFPGHDDVVPLNNMCGQNFGYYCGGAFVRKQGAKGYRCDKDLSYRCRHVSKVCEKFGLALGTGASFEVGDMSDEENGEPYDDVEAICTDFGYGDISFRYPYTHSMQRIVMELAEKGFGNDPSHPRLWFGDALMPKLPSAPCKCGNMYSARDYVRVSTCKVYLGTPHCGREMDVYQLNCPDSRMNCIVRYNGLEHGLVRIGPGKVVELDLLVENFLDVVRFGGASLTAQCEKLQERYARFKKPGARQIPFLEANCFRQAVYTVAKNMKLHHTLQEMPRPAGDTAESSSGPNPCICPICEDQPDLLTMDGTSLTMRSEAFRSASMTSASCTVIKKRPHTRSMRKFLNVVPFGDRTGHASTKLAKLLRDFCEWLSDVSNLSKGGTPQFKDLKSLLTLANRWNIERFVSWAHREARRMSTQQVRAVCLLLLCISSNNSVTQYCTYSVGKKIEEYGSRGWQDVPWTECVHLGPVVGKLLDAFRTDGSPTVTIHADWVPVLNEMIERVYVVHTRMLDGEEYGLGPSIPVPSQPTAVDSSHVHTGVCSGLPKIRERPIYEMDGDMNESKDLEGDKAGCKHNFVKPGARTGGVFSCVCEHGVCYAIFVIKNAEGRNEPFTWMTTHLRRAPKYVVYDFACSLMEYCLNRAPNFFKHTLFLVDRFHWLNHIACCPTFNIREHQELADRIRNSQACEQLNAAIKRLKFVVSKMNQEPFMLFLRLFAYNWNVKKLEKIMKLKEGQPKPLVPDAGRERMRPGSCMAAGQSCM